MPPNPEVIARYQRRLADHRARASAVLVTSWNRLGSWDQADVTRYERQTAPAMAGIKAATVALSAGFLSLYLAQPPVGVDPDNIDVTPDLTGPFHATWHALAIGRPIADALSAGRSVASAAGYDFVQHTSRRTGDHATPRGTRWRRIPGGNACDWCLLVSRDDYLSAESADFGHQRDDCIVVPA